MAEKREVMISMDPMMAAKFAESTHFSRKLELHVSNPNVFYHYSIKRRVGQYAEDE